jgi:hypothetical protein
VTTTGGGSYRIRPADMDCSRLSSMLVVTGLVTSGMTLEKVENKGTANVLRSLQVHESQECRRGISYVITTSLYPALKISIRYIPSVLPINPR